MLSVDLWVMVGTSTGKLRPYLVTVGGDEVAICNFLACPDACGWLGLEWWRAKEVAT